MPRNDISLRYKKGGRGGKWQLILNRPVQPTPTKHAVFPRTRKNTGVLQERSDPPMVNTKQIEMTPETARKLEAPIREAERRITHFDRVCDLEYTLVKARDALAVITRGLEDFVNNHEAPEDRTLTHDDVSMIYGTVNLLEYIAAECGRAVAGKETSEE